MDKKVALIGASGFVGSAILNELLNRGYQVEALVNHPEKIKISNPALTVKKVDVSDEKSLENDLKGYSSVISAYNPGWANPNIYEETLTNYPKILEAAKKAGAQVAGGMDMLVWQAVSAHHYWHGTAFSNHAVQKIISETAETVRMQFGGE